jgi:PKD repeat protein
MGRTLSTRSLIAGLAASLLLAACTTRKQEAPALTGPSALGTSLTITVSPDVLTQDGASQSLVQIQAYDSNGQPLRNTSMRVDIVVNGSIADFGTLSARNVVTDTSGRAAVVYTAPAAPPISIDSGTLVQIVVTPTSGDFGNATARFASIRLTPPGSVSVPPDALAASFIFTPGAPSTDTPVVFDASAVATNNPGVTIVSYAWDFGDGATGNGRQASHQYSSAGTYTVKLTVRDATNKSGTATQTVTVGVPSTGLSADFVFSPNPAQLSQPIHFDASTSVVSPPHRIVSYSWNWGDGGVETTGSPRIDHVYQMPRTYVIVLTVTDETGQTKTTTKTITPQ